MDRHINLYLDLEPGEFADLEVVAKASLAFAAAVREIAYIVDPSSNVRLELESGTEGSLSLNSIVRFAKEKIQDPVTRAAIIGAVVAWFAKEAGSALIGLGVTEVVTDEPAITEQDAERIAEKIKEILEKKIGSGPVQDVFKHLEKDKSIKGVGVTTKKGARPTAIVPRVEFHERSGSQPPEPSDKRTRTRTESQLLTLVSPVLQRNNNKWRFSSKDGMIYAAVKDEAFLEGVLSGNAHIPMKSGILIFAEVEIKEKRENDAWEITERSITKVTGIRAGDDTRDLFSDK